MASAPTAASSATCGDRLPGLDLVMGDFNALGPTSLVGFRDVGPRRATHRAYGIVPVRLDRCLARGLRCTAATALAFGKFRPQAPSWSNSCRIALG